MSAALAPPVCRFRMGGAGPRARVEGHSRSERQLAANCGKHRQKKEVGYFSAMPADGNARCPLAAREFRHFPLEVAAP